MSESLSLESSGAPMDQAWVINVLQALQVVHAKFSLYSRQVTAATGLSVPQLLCLEAIRECEPEEMTGAQIAVRIGMSHATVSRLLVRLESGRWVVKKRSLSDRRKQVLKLTALGRRKLQKVPSILGVTESSLISALDPRARLALLEHLTQVLMLLGEQPTLVDRLGADEVSRGDGSELSSV